MCPLNDKNYILLYFELKFAGEAWSLSYIVIVDRSVCCGLDNFCNKQDHSGLHSAHSTPLVEQLQKCPAGQEREGREDTQRIAKCQRLQSYSSYICSSNGEDRLISWAAI